jgi:hypothetical protein
VDVDTDLYGDYGRFDGEGSRPDPLGMSEGTRWATMEERQGNFEHCSPWLLESGVDCGETPRRSCECDHGGSHDHLVESDEYADGA